MKLGIMQPYFFPYIGYFQLINAVDTFVIYDNIQFTKKGWIHRNRMLQNGSDVIFTLPIKKNSDYLDIVERQLSDAFPAEAEKLKRRIGGNYRKAPYYEDVMPLILQCLDYPDKNLFSFIEYSIISICNYLGLHKRIIKSSQLDSDAKLKGKERVMAICKELEAETYVNPIGGIKLYEKNEFKDMGIKLQFIRRGDIHYKQFNHPFVPDLSIIDVLMFTSVSEVKSLLENYHLA